MIQDLLFSIQTFYTINVGCCFLYMAFIFSCFILGAAFFRSRRASRSSSLRCRSGSSISLIRSLISRRFHSRSSWARSALAAWIDFQKASATLLRFFSALFLASRDRRNLFTYNKIHTWCYSFGYFVKFLGRGYGFYYLGSFRHWVE